MIKFEDINFQNVQESFGMGGPYLGDLFLRDNKLRGKFLADNQKYSDDKKYLLLSWLKGELGFISRDFRIMIIDRKTNKFYQSKKIESALYIVRMNDGVITYHQAFHDGIKKFEREIKFDRANFEEIIDKEIYE